MRDAILADLEDNYASGASVAILDHGEIIFAEGFGSADPDSDVPVTTTMLFQIGSNTKMYTSAAMLRLQDAGLLSMDDTVADHIPEMALQSGIAGPADTSAITMHDLLSHQGAFTDAIDWTGDSDDAGLDTYWAETYGQTYGLLNAPGEFWNYSNPNFGVAGVIEERLDPAARAWPDIIREDILLPLGMDRTYARKSEVEADGEYALSYGYKPNRTASWPFESVSMDKITDAASVRPAGMIWSTPTQLLSFADFLMHGNSDVLSDASRAALTSEQVNTLYAGDEGWYGYGIFKERSIELSDGLHRIPVWDHGGNTLSFTCTWYVLPEQDWAIAILSNGYGDYFYPSVTTAIETLVALDPGEPVEEPTLDTDRLDDFVGTYQAQSNVGEMIITRDGDGLVATLPMLDDVDYPYDPVLIPYSTTIWYIEFDGVYYDLTFVGEEGEPAGWIRNRSFVATRGDDSGE